MVAVSYLFIFHLTVRNEPNLKHFEQGLLGGAVSPDFLGISFSRWLLEN